MDESHFEYAQQLEEGARTRAIMEARERHERSKRRPVGFLGLCGTCDEQIDRKRVDAGYYECVDCVSERELRARQYNPN